MRWSVTVARSGHTFDVRLASNALLCLLTSHHILSQYRTSTLSIVHPIVFQMVMRAAILRWVVSKKCKNRASVTYSIGIIATRLRIVVLRTTPAEAHEAVSFECSFCCAVVLLRE